MGSNPFEILNIPAGSDAESIKKAFRELIKKNHPDIAGGTHDKTASIIEAYHEAIKKRSSPERNAKDKNNSYDLFKLKYEMFFAEQFDLPSSKSAYFTHLKMLMKNIKSFLYSKGDFEFLTDYVNVLISNITAFRDPAIVSWADFIYVIFENYRYLLGFRKDILSDKFDNEEYEFEKLRLNIIKYFNNIASSKNYIDLRCCVFSEKDILITDCIKAINRTAKLTYRQEIFTLMSIIVLFVEDEFMAYYADFITS